MSQIGDFMVVVSPGDSFLLQLVFWLEFSILTRTLAYPGRGSQAGFPALTFTHSTPQNMIIRPAALHLALWRCGRNADGQIEKNSGDRIDVRLAIRRR
jgi:hypothetical protein